MAGAANQQEESRILRLEETMTHQTKTVEELSEMVSRQWEVIDRLEKKLDALTSRFMVLEEAAKPSIENTRPPHY